MSGPISMFVSVSIGFAAILAAVRVLRPGRVADRTLGLDLLVLTFACGIAVRSIGAEESFMPVVTVVALMAFLATASVAAFAGSTREDTDGRDH